MVWHYWRSTHIIDGVSKTLLTSSSSDLGFDSHENQESQALSHISGISFFFPFLFALTVAPRCTQGSRNSVHSRVSSRCCIKGNPGLMEMRGIQCTGVVACLKLAGPSRLWCCIQAAAAFLKMVGTPCIGVLELVKLTGRRGCVAAAFTLLWFF